MTNPILEREFRTRWRDKRSYILLLLILVSLVGLIWWLYRDYTTNFGYGARWAFGGYGAHSPAHFSRTLFECLVLGNAIACFLVAPGLTAATIASEREKGLLESLWLSQMSMRSVVLGRFVTTLAYLLIIEVTVLPLMGICVIVGGVSPAEIGLALLLGLSGGTVGLAMGLLVSAAAHRPTGAIISAYVNLFVWSVLALVPRVNITPLPSWLSYFVCAHPVYAAFIFTHPNEHSSFVFNPGGTLFEHTDHVVLVGCGLTNVAAVLMLGLAVRRATRPLSPPVWLKGKNPRLEAWRRDLEARRRESKERNAVHLSQNMEGALLAEIPVAKLVNFRNPLLRREVRARFRFRQAGLAVRLVRLCALLFAGGVWALSLMYTTNNATKNLAVNLLFSTVPVALVPAVAIMAAQAFTREREAGTWEGLRLSLIQDGDLIRSKWLAPLITSVYWVAPYLLLLPLCLGTSWGEFSGMYRISITQLVALVALVASWAALASSIGVTCSWRCKSTSAATCWTVGVLAVLTVGLTQFDPVLLVARYCAWTGTSLGWDWPNSIANQLITLGPIDPIYLWDNLKQPGYSAHHYSRYSNNEEVFYTPMRRSLALNLAVAWTIASGCLLYVYKRLHRERDVVR